MYEFKTFLGLPELMLISGIVSFLMQGVVFIYLSYPGPVAPWCITLAVISCVTFLVLAAYMVLVLDKEQGIWERSAAMNESALRRSKGINEASLGTTMKGIGMVASVATTISRKARQGKEKRAHKECKRQPG